MCGIFGIVGGGERTLAADATWRITHRLFELSETRGKEASGLALLVSPEARQLTVIKSPATASVLIRHPTYRGIFKNGSLNDSSPLRGALIGHTRLVTNGSQLDARNNQPVVRDDIVAVHNGIIVNVAELWQAHPDLNRETDVDTEVLVALLAKYQRDGASLVHAVRRVYADIRGTASCAITLSDRNVTVLVTNHGSLYVAQGSDAAPLIFASERHTLDCLFRSRLGSQFAGYRIQHIVPNSGVIMDHTTGRRFDFTLAGTEDGFRPAPVAARRKIDTVSVGRPAQAHSVFEIRHVTVPASFEAAVVRTRAAVESLRRCTRCILPETVPFIEFDASGVCNFCRFHKAVDLKGREALEQAIAPYRRPGQEADCVCSISGGRDSCYGLHYVVKELGMKPIAYTYDWGMVTDLARRNISRMCSALGVEHILISANIPRKRENIRKNIVAWLNKPHIGMIPLFMAGDKQFVWYGNRIKKQTGLQLDFFTFNLFEKTQFKEEYSGIPFWKPGVDADKLGEELGVWRGIKLCSYYGGQFLANPGYWNASLFDTFYGFVTYYVLPRTFVALFRYVPWREDVVVNTLRKEYDWELATDTQSTWRIGDGTASFYNYIYFTLGGFTEHDTLRAGQVREGHLKRDDALRLVTEDNRPRWDSFKWYCDIVGLDFEATVARIHAMPRVSPKLETT